MDVNEVDYIKIGQRIRAARLKLGWQQAEVAFRAGLTTSHMSHIETGQTKVALPTVKIGGRATAARSFSPALTA